MSNSGGGFRAASDGSMYGHACASKSIAVAAIDRVRDDKRLRHTEYFFGWCNVTALPGTGNGKKDCFERGREAGAKKKDTKT